MCIPPFRADEVGEGCPSFLRIVYPSLLRVWRSALWDMQSQYNADPLLHKVYSWSVKLQIMLYAPHDWEWHWAYFKECFGLYTFTVDLNGVEVEFIWPPTWLEYIKELDEKTPYPDPLPIGCAVRGF